MDMDKVKIWFKIIKRYFKGSLYTCENEDIEFNIIQPTCYFDQKECAVHMLEDTDEFRLAAKTSSGTVFYKKSEDGKIGIRMRLGRQKMQIQDGQIVMNRIQVDEPSRTAGAIT